MHNNSVYIGRNHRSTSDFVPRTSHAAPITSARQPIQKPIKQSAAQPKQEPFKTKKHRGLHLFLALACATATVGALAYFVQLNVPDISVKVAALQTGISASVPSYTPRGYTLSNVTSDGGNQIVISYAGPNEASFTLTEEKTTWDSTALLNNLVKENFQSDYSTLREQGITIYTDGTHAAWINGGILFQTTAMNANLSKEIIRNIVVSL